MRDLREELSAHSGYPCVTLTMPTSRTMPGNAEDPIRLKNLVSQAEKRMTEEVGKRPSAQALANLRHAAGSIDHNRNYEGLAIFANETVEQVVKTRFPLPERVTVDETFSLRALLRAERRAEPYALLVLSLKDALLYEGVREDLFEVRSGGFPMENRGAGGGSKVPGGPSVSRTASVDGSRADFVRECLSAVEGLEDVPTRLVVTGTEEVLSEARSAIRSPLELLGTISGSYVGSNVAELGRLAWEVVRDARRAQSAQVVADLDKARAARTFEAGLQALAPLAVDGRIARLVVGMGYEAAGRYDADRRSLDLIDAPSDWGDMDDAVEWVIAEVLRTQGEVVFVEDEVLGEEPIMAVLRY